MQTLYKVTADTWNAVKAILIQNSAAHTKLIELEKNQNLILSKLAAIENLLQTDIAIDEKISEAVLPGVATKIKFIFQGLEITTMNLKDNQNLPIALVAEDKFGNVTTLDGVPVWNLSDDTMGSLVVETDGMKAMFMPNGKIGSVMVQVLGVAGGNQIMGELSIDVIAGTATMIVLQPGAPVDM